MSPDTAIVLITGANSGVGYAASEVISGASEKYHVIIGSRSAENGQKAVAEIEANGGVKGSLSSVVIDVEDQSSIDQAAKQIEEEYGRLDVLVNNAGISAGVRDLSPDMAEKTFKVNVIGPMRVAAAFEPLLLKSKHPVSIYVSSVMGSLNFASDKNSFAYDSGWTTYRQSKAALNMWVIENSITLGKQGVKVFGMCPGFVVSNLRGKGEAERGGWGNATDPRVSGETMLSIIEGKRDADVGRLVHKDGIYDW